MNDKIINVLYVDDEQQNLISFTAAFRKDFNVFTALSAKESDSILINNQIHVLITDQRMPNTLGTELLSHVVSKYPYQSRILLTGFTDIEALIDAFGTAGQTYSVGPGLGVDIQSGTPFDCGGGGCGGCLMGGMSANSLSSSSSSSSNDTYFGQMATATNTDYPQYADEMIFQNQQLVYRLQKQGSLSTTSTNQLNSFYTANQNSNIGKFYDVQSALANNQKSLAQSKNNSIIPSNAVQQKTQRTYELLLKMNMNSNYKYSSSEIQDLNNMANECPVKGWYVSQSRSILNAINGNIVEYTNECGEIKSGSRMASEENIASIKVIPTMFNLYPNPNNGFMTMYYDLGNDKDADMNLYDVTGKLINSYKLENSVGTIEINEADLHNGIYFYRILVNGNIINTNKVVIIK